MNYTNANEMYTLLIQILMASAGAIARILYQKGNKPPKQFLTILSEIFIASFTAIILYWITYSTQIDRGIMFATAGIAGWIGPTVLHLLTNIIAHQNGIDLNIENSQSAQGEGNKQ